MLLLLLFLLLFLLPLLLLFILLLLLLLFILPLPQLLHLLTSKKWLALMMRFVHGDMIGGGAAVGAGGGEGPQPA